MEKLKLYNVNSEYLIYLHNNYDDKIVTNIKNKKNRKYLGILLKVNDINYLAPLTSPKSKHLKMKNTLDFIKINDGLLGAINLNNMFPVDKKDIKEVLPKNEKNNTYGNLLEKQITWMNLNKNKDRIKKSTFKLYLNLSKNKEKSPFYKRCCDFKALEKACLEWQNLQEKEIIYNPLTGIEFSIINQKKLQKQHFSNPRWIAKGEVEKNNIKIKIKEQPTIINIFFLKENKLIEKKIKIYNLSQLEVPNEVELTFRLPKVKQEKLISKKIDKEIER